MAKNKTFCTRYAQVQVNGKNKDSKLHKANKWARGAKEVLVEGEIPADKVNYGNNTKKYTCRG